MDLNEIRCSAQVEYKFGIIDCGKPAVILMTVPGKYGTTEGVVQARCGKCARLQKEVK